VVEEAVVRLALDVGDAVVVELVEPDHGLGVAGIDGEQHG
jgi:hypothetical protein